MKLSDLIDEAEFEGACDDAIFELRKCRTWEDVSAHPDVMEWAEWALENDLLPELSQQQLRPIWGAYWDAMCDAATVHEIRFESVWAAHPVVRLYMWEARYASISVAKRQFASAVYELLKGGLQ